MSKRMIVDILMVVLLPFLMAYSLISETLHEFGGLAMLALFTTHHVLNRAWFKTLRRGPYSAVRTVNTVIDLLLLLDMVLMAVSGVLISKHALTFLGISGGTAIGRVLHMIGAYWGYVLMSVHLGFHGGVMGARMGILKQKRLCTALRFFFAAVSLYGIYAFVRRQFPAYMFLQQLFVFIDTSEPVILFLLDYLSIMILFATLAYYGMKALRLGQESRKKKQNGDKSGSRAVPQSTADAFAAAGKRGKRKKRLIILAAVLVIAVAAGLIWGVPYVRRHFVTVRIDRGQATAMAPAGLSGKTLAVYFTRVGNSDFEPDVDATSSASLMLDENGTLMGNAELIALMVQNAADADVCPIRVAPESRYPSSYGDTVSVAGDEKDGETVPVLDLSAGLPDLDDYERIVLIIPLWWWTVPKAVELWLGELDWTGREVCLVVTHGGSGAGSAPQDLAAMIPGGTVNENVLTVYDDDADEAADSVYAWLKSLR